jgi:hypothetical protein
MSTIDIPLPDSLTSALSQPLCIDLSLPKPHIPTLTLPTGGTLKGLADFTKGIPTDCSMNFSLALMIAPIMASMECLLKILKFLGDIIEAAKSASPPKLLGAITDGADALASCLALATPVGLFCFVKSLLQLIARMLHCALDALTSVVDLLDGLELSMSTALQNGNTDQIAALQCAQENAAIAASSALTSLEPVMMLLQLAEPFFAITNISIDPIPDVSGSAGVQGLKSVIETLTPIVQAIETIADGIPC